MIIARSESGKGDPEVFVFGLSMMNVGKMLTGEPLFISSETHGEGCPKGCKIALMVGETEESMLETFKKMGLISPDTKVSDMRKGAEHGNV